MMNENRTDIENKREYSRVETYIPLEFKQVAREHRCGLRSRTSGDAFLAEFKSLPNPDDQTIAQWLQTINLKLNEIIRMMTIQQDGFHCMSMSKVNIGGGGMSFFAGRSFAPGDILEFKLMLTMQRPMALFLYGEVIEVETSPQGYDTSVRFIAIDDFIRDEIIKFVFETEREILREKRR
ncbi:MAG: PilZ domain-containing protein [Smithellaceae bacterium]